jgi:hypothetical protein
MKFIFVCPVKQEAFETEAFEIIENQGVITDDAGNKTLDATVKLSSPCPFCGENHVFHASEMVCPLSGSKGIQK